MLDIISLFISSHSRLWANEIKKISTNMKQSSKTSWESFLLTSPLAPQYCDISWFCEIWTNFAELLRKHFSIAAAAAVELNISDESYVYWLCVCGVDGLWISNSFLFPLHHRHSVERFVCNLISMPKDAWMERNFRMRNEMKSFPSFSFCKRKVYFLVTFSLYICHDRRKRISIKLLDNLSLSAVCP